MKRHIMKWLTLGVVALALAGCGSGTTDTGSAPASLSGVASKGPVKSGTATAWALNEDGSKGAELGTTTTSATDGSYSIPTTYAGDIIVEVTGGTYTDEATGTIKTNTLLRAVVSGATGAISVYVSPLTEISTRKALTPSADSMKTRIDNANAIVGTMAGNINIINTKPVDITSASASAAATADEITYGLMLATISQMIEDGQAVDVDAVIANLLADIEDDGIVNTSGAGMLTSLSNFLADVVNNQSGVTATTQTKLDEAINFASTNPINATGAPDLAKAKGLVRDLRNTGLAIFNYDGVGAKGIVETPFNNLANEMNAKIAPQITSTFGSVAELLGIVDPTFPDGTYSYTHPWSGDILSYTLATTSSRVINFTITDFLLNPLSDGTLTFTIDLNENILTGIFTGTINDIAGDISATLNYAATTNATTGALATMTATGSMSGQGLSIDFSQGGRKLDATLALDPTSQPGFPEVYPTSISGALQITTETAKLEGTFAMAGVWANKAGSYGYWYWDGVTSTWVEVCYGDVRPSSATLTGAFSEISGGTPTGMQMSGTLTGTWSNAATYDGCSAESATNFPAFTASYNGTIQAPARPTVAVLFTANQSVYNQYPVTASYTRTNPNNTVVSLSASATGTGAGISSVTLNNQDGLVGTIGLDDTLACNDPARLSGTLKTSGGTTLANFYDLDCVPMISYTDGYFESLL